MQDAGGARLARASQSTSKKLGGGGPCAGQIHGALATTFKSRPLRSSRGGSSGDARPHDGPEGRSRAMQARTRRRGSTSRRTSWRSAFSRGWMSRTQRRWPVSPTSATARRRRLRPSSARATATASKSTSSPTSSPTPAPTSPTPATPAGKAASPTSGAYGGKVIWRGGSGAREEGAQIWRGRVGARDPTGDASWRRAWYSPASRRRLSIGERDNPVARSSDVRPVAVDVRGVFRKCAGLATRPSDGLYMP